MKIMHPVLSKPIEFRENKFPVVVPELTTMFRDWVLMLIEQSQGKHGDFILSDGICNILECGKHLFIINNYFDLSFESRTFQN